MMSCIQRKNRWIFSGSVTLCYSTLFSLPFPVEKMSCDPTSNFRKLMTEIWLNFFILSDVVSREWIVIFVTSFSIHSTVNINLHYENINTVMTTVALKIVQIALQYNYCIATFPTLFLYILFIFQVRCVE